MKEKTKKSKLGLKKVTISNLTNLQKKEIHGGQMPASCLQDCKSTLLERTCGR